jgi:MFS family permease
LTAARAETSQPFSKDKRVFSWFGEMSKRERNTFWACFGGWALDAMDVQLYAVAMPTLIGLWSLSRAEAGLLGTSALITSSLGGWLAGMLADRIGRVRVLQLTILWFSTFTFLSGLTNSYEQLLIVRSLQGLGFGGEWAAGAVLMAEVIRPTVRGRAVGCVQSGWSVGYGAAALLFTGIFSIFPPAQAWRYLFFVGILPGVAIFFIRRHVEEPDIFKAIKKDRHGDPASRSVLVDIFKTPLRRSTFVASLLAAGTLGGNYTTLTWLPTYLTTIRDLNVLSTGAYLAVNICGSFCGYVISAHLSDWLGRRRTFAVCAIFATVTISFYMLAPIGNVATLLLGFPLGFFQSGIVAGMGATFAELFPTYIRATGQGFSYNFGRAAGSFMPFAVGSVSATVGLDQAISACAVFSYTLVLVAVALLPETKGTVLQVHAPQPEPVS